MVAFRPSNFYSIPWLENKTAYNDDLFGFYGRRVTINPGEAKRFFSCIVETEEQSDAWCQQWAFDLCQRCYFWIVWSILHSREICTWYMRKSYLPLCSWSTIYDVHVPVTVIRPCTNNKLCRLINSRLHVSPFRRHNALFKAQTKLENAYADHTTPPPCLLDEVLCSLRNCWYFLASLSAELHRNYTLYAFSKKVANYIENGTATNRPNCLDLLGLSAPIKLFCTHKQNQKAKYIGLQDDQKS